MSFGRPLAYDPDSALDAAMHLFWLQGYEATSLQDLLKATGLSKSSLYLAFGGKKALFLICVNRYCSKVSAVLQSHLDESKTGLAFIGQMLLNAAAEACGDTARRGCLLMNTATAFAQKDPEIACRVNIGLEGLRGIFERAVLRGQREGEITTEKDAKSLAGYLVCSLGGIKTVVKGGSGEADLREIVDIVLRGLK